MQKSTTTKIVFAVTALFLSLGLISAFSSQIFIGTTQTTASDTLTFTNTVTVPNGTSTFSGGTVLLIVNVHTTNVTSTISINSTTTYVANVTSTTTTFIP